MSEFTWHDTNGDGVGDVGTVDTSGDGLVDISAHDTDLDGRVDSYLVDENRDGIMGDRVVTDANRDGVLDASGWDVNQDGALDYVANAHTGGQVVSLNPRGAVISEGVTMPQMHALPETPAIDASGTFQETLVQALERETDPNKRALIEDAIRRQNRHVEFDPFTR